jgi:hypothetical protein
VLDLDRDPSPQSPQSPFMTIEITTMFDVCYVTTRRFPSPKLSRKNKNERVITPRPETMESKVQDGSMTTIVSGA